MRSSVDVHNLLEDQGIRHEIFLVESPAKTAERAAALLQLKPSEVAKSVLFLAEAQPVLVILPGSKRVNYKKLKKVLGTNKVYLAEARQVVDLTGYVLGATPPLAHENKVRTLMDRSLLEVEVLYTGGGEPNAMLKIKPQDLKKVTAAEIVEVAQDFEA